MRWTLIIAATLPLTALATPGLEALCQGARTADVVVGADEFAIIGFDVETQALSIRPPRTLLSDDHGPCRLRLDDEDLLLPVQSEAVQLILDAWKASALELMVRVERLDQDLPPERIACQQLKPVSVELRIGELKVAERVLSEPLPHPGRRAIHVGALLAESWVKPFPTRGLRDAVQLLAQVCLKRQTDAPFDVRGSISVELRKSPEGRPLRPTLAVDGLVNDSLTHCLLREMADDPMVWRDLPANALVYVPVFFRASAPPAPPRPRRDPMYIRAVWSPTD